MEVQFCEIHCLLTVGVQLQIMLHPRHSGADKLKHEKPNLYE
jgi:hypothetical protein